jgi:hypothetical protein
MLKDKIEKKSFKKIQKKLESIRLTHDLSHETEITS